MGTIERPQRSKAGPQYAVTVCSKVVAGGRFPSDVSLSIVARSKKNA